MPLFRSIFFIYPKITLILLLPFNKKQQYRYPRRFYIVMKIRVLFILLVGLLINSRVQAKTSPYFTFNDEVRLAYQRALELRVQESSLLLATEKRENPNNYMVYFIENYLDFMRVFIDEDEEAFDSLTKNKDRRLELIEAGDTNSPYYLYTQAEIKLQWALLHLKFDEYLSALSNIRSAYKMLNKNLAKHPDFIASKKSLGLLHALVGTVPDNYRWAVKLLAGMDGTIEQGRREIEEVIDFHRKNGDKLFETETSVFYAFLMLHLNNSSNDRAWNILNSGELNPKTSALACFVLSNMAMRIGKNDLAIQMLENRPRGAEFYRMPYLEFMLGLAKFRRLDQDAPQYLQNYISNMGNGNYVKEAYQKIAWFHLLNDNELLYQQYMTFCKSYGRTSVGSDKSAQTEAENKDQPNPILLKARVLFDGGYYSRAEKTLLNYQPTNFTDPGLQLEYIYRLGRIFHESGATQNAINYYQKTIDQGRSKKYYYACNAALKMGLLYETAGEKTKAKTAYDACLDMSPNQYKHSLHGKAKAGLNRLSN